MNAHRTSVAGLIAARDQQNWPLPHTKALVARMLSYDGQFHAFPDLDHQDSMLINEALFEQTIQDGTVLLCGLAGVHIRSDPARYTRCMEYVLDYATHCWNANLPEGEERVARLGGSVSPRLD